MKNIILSIAIVLLLFGMVAGQTTRQADSDSIAVTTSDTTIVYSPRWETANITFSGCDGLVKYAFSSQDTTWSDKTWYGLPEAAILIIFRDNEKGIPGLYAIKAKAASGSGAMFITGSRTNDG